MPLPTGTTAQDCQAAALWGKKVKLTAEICNNGIDDDGESCLLTWWSALREYMSYADMYDMALRAPHYVYPSAPASSQPAILIMPAPTPLP